MEKKLFLILFSVVMLLSCSDNTFVEESMEPMSETRADSPLLITTPTELYFNNVRVLESKTENLNVKNAGLSSLGVLTRFDVTVQGDNSIYFEVESPTLDFSELLQTLLGGGIDIPVTYRPTIPGPHEAELLITASLLGVLAPIQITVPLHGTTQSAPIPKLLYSIPKNFGIVEWDGRVRAEVIDKGQYHIDFVFDQPIYFTFRSGPGNISLTPPTSAFIINAEIVNINTLRVTITEDIIKTTNQLVVLKGTITSLEGLRTGESADGITLIYRASDNEPQNYID